MATTVEAVLAAGAVGINLEDGPGRDGAPLFTASDQVARIAAARRAAEAARVEVFINARTDVFLRAVGDPGGRVAAAAERANACLDAGADCAFVPGVADLATIARLVESIRGPVNVLAGPAGPSVPQLAGVGVARVSLGCEFAQAVLASVERATREVLERGTFEALADGVSYPEANGLFAHA